MFDVHIGISIHVSMYMNVCMYMVARTPHTRLSTRGNLLCLCACVFHRNSELCHDLIFAGCVDACHTNVCTYLRRTVSVHAAFNKTRGMSNDEEYMYAQLNIHTYTKKNAYKHTHTEPDVSVHANLTRVYPQTL